MKLYWKVKINGKWTFRKARLWRFEPTALVDNDGEIDGFMGGVFVPNEILESWREQSRAWREIE